MIALNRVELIGFLTEDPKVREISGWTNVADVNLVVKTITKTKNWENQEITSFHNITFWRGLADVIKNYTRKWSQVYISWRLETESWEDQDWNKKYRTKVTWEDLILLSKKEAVSAPSWIWKIWSWLNKAEIIWNVTQDIELRATPNWTNVTSFGVATNRQWKTQSWETQEKVEFHNVVAWEKIAENINNYVQKWSKVFISWRVQTRSWDAPDWTKKYTTEIIAESARLLGFTETSWWRFTEAAEPTAQQEPAQTQASAPAGQNQEVPEISYASEIKPEDLPF